MDYCWFGEEELEESLRWRVVIRIGYQPVKCKRVNWFVSNNVEKRKRIARFGEP